MVWRCHTFDLVYIEWRFGGELCGREGRLAIYLELVEAVSIGEASEGEMAKWTGVMTELSRGWDVWEEYVVKGGRMRVE